jgi:hypothetical protein
MKILLCKWKERKDNEIKKQSSHVVGIEA